MEKVLDYLFGFMLVVFVSLVLIVPLLIYLIFK